VKVASELTDHLVMPVTQYSAVRICWF